MEQTQRTKPCECNCGQEVRTTRWRDSRTNRIRRTRFLPGHHMSTGNYRQNVKLTEDEVRRIKRFLAQGKMTHEHIGRRFGVTKGCISSINKGQSWTHVTI